MITYTQEEIVSSQELALSLDTYMDKVISGDVEKIAIVHNDALSLVLLSLTEYERMTNALAFLQNDPELSKLFQEQNFTANEEKQQHPLKLLYSGVDIKIDEQEKCIIINPAGERFYNSGCDDLHTIFRDASLSQDANGNYQIQGVQTLYNEHKDSGMNYENLLCKHPQQLIKKRSFLGLFTYYNVNGSMKRDVKTLYVCEHKNYQISQRLELLSEQVEGA
ncbi:MAG: hypothetical protein WC667_12990 [Sulfurimonas sp.]|jgi:PHD/YefM family antitoxin component YafN of YafNO toxin-antitoxin module